MTGRQRTLILVLIVIAVIGVGIGSEWLAHGSRLGFVALRDLLTGWLIAACGLVAWAWVPGSRIGLLLFVTGLAWFVGTVADPLTLTGQLAGTLRFVYAAVLAQALFTWPSGRTSSALDRILVLGGYFVAVFPPLWERDIGLVVIAALLVAGIAVQRWAESPRARRIRRPATVTGIGLAVALAGKGTAAAVMRSHGVTYPGDSEAIWQIALVLVAVGLASSLVALERRRQRVTDVIIRLGAVGPVDPAVELAAAAGLADDAEVSRALERVGEMATRNARLREELGARVSAIEASRRRLLDAEDDERAALEARLRRGTVARLMDLESALASERSAIAHHAPEALARLERAVDQLRLAIVELNELARGLDPALLRERGLADALKDLAARSPIPVELSLQLLPFRQAGVERTLFYVASEALANVAKHARATRAGLRLMVEGSAVRLVIEDDGIGLAGAHDGSGLRGLRDRVDAIGGAMSIATREGGGTTLRVTLPLGAVTSS
jgi:signal transduction histidine kinase